ncbi:MAG: hypothetical protein ACOCVR_04220, partial [Myxococcota bacterium]
MLPRGKRMAVGLSLAALALLLLLQMQDDGETPAPGLFEIRDGGSTAFADLAAGTASTSITPDEPIPLGGFFARWGRAFTSVRDEAEARVLVLEAGR